MANLPEDILKLVFKSFAEVKSYSYESWAEQLVLLSVCQRWRHCALPLVGHCAGFYFKNSKNNAELESIDDSLITNFGHLTTIGHLNLIRNLDIFVDHNNNIFECIMHVLNMLSGQLHVWSKLRAINLVSISRIPGADNSVDEALALARTSNIIVDRMSGIMPNIVKLEFKTMYNNNISKMLYGRLVDLYAQNLNALISFKPVPLDDINVFSRLAYLHISCGNNPSISLPMVHIDTLECLILHSLPVSMQWYKFAHGQSKKLMFSNLRKLELRYIESIDSDTLSAKSIAFPEFHFPKLKYLKISHPSEHQPLLSHSVFNPELEVLNINSSISSLNQLTGFKLQSVKRLTLNTTFTNHGSLANALNTLTNVAKVAQIVDTMRLVIINQAPIDLTGCEFFPPLTSLEILTIPNHEQLFSLVQCLPCLKRLRLNSVNTNNINLDELKALLETQQTIAPISSTVQYVSVNYNRRSLKLQTAISFTTLLVVGLPALRWLYASPVAQDILLEIINESKARYAHLDNVQILCVEQFLLQEYQPRS